MFEYITHYYNGEPFRSLSALSRTEAIRVMEELVDDSPYFERFKDPLQYWSDRVETETWLRKKFMEKGGKPQEGHPFYAVLRSSDSIENYASSAGIEIGNGTCRQ